VSSNELEALEGQLAELDSQRASASKYPWGIPTTCAVASRLSSVAASSLGILGSEDALGSSALLHHRAKILFPAASAFITIAIPFAIVWIGACARSLFAIAFPSAVIGIGAVTSTFFTIAFPSTIIWRRLVTSRIFAITFPPAVVRKFSPQACANW
jgi:hypothetical protein